MYRTRSSWSNSTSPFGSASNVASSSAARRSASWRASSCRSRSAASSRTSRALRTASEARSARATTKSTSFGVYLRPPAPAEARISVPSGSAPFISGATMAEARPISLSSWYCSSPSTPARSISSVISSNTSGRFCTSAFASFGPASHRRGFWIRFSFSARSRCRGSGWYAADCRSTPSGPTSENAHQSPIPWTTFSTMRRSGSSSSPPTESSRIAEMSDRMRCLRSASWRRDRSASNWVCSATGPPRLRLPRRRPAAASTPLRASDSAHDGLRRQAAFATVRDPMDARITPEIVRQHGLTEDEYRRIVGHLGRDPNLVELGIFSAMWSEHCSYKSSRRFLKHLPTKGPRVLQGPGENAGVVDVGGGLAVAFKMESHNHPSYIEPYQGAATGVGGILRDVFTMGARPIASLNSLRFGKPSHPKTARLLEGVVAGIAGYGNCIGVPTVGGEVAFDESRDGNHGATMASAEFDQESESKRPTVQVGDPFLEKLLLEACLELFKTDCLVGIQDMGAAGLTSSSVEMAARAGSGLELDVDAVPRRETGMTPYEVMLSESQERMLLVAKKGREREVFEICDKWDLVHAVVGRVTGTGKLVVKSEGKTVAELPIAPLTDQAPSYDRPRRRPEWLDEARKLDLAQVPEPGDLAGALKQVLASPTVASKEWVYRQYDHMVRIGTAVRSWLGDAVVD